MELFCLGELWPEADNVSKTLHKMFYSVKIGYQIYSFDTKYINAGICIDH